MDTEFDNIATAVSTKYDSNDLSSQAEAEAGTSNTVLMTPLRTENWADTWAAENAGIIGDLQALAAPGADRLYFWDNSAGAMVALTVGTNLDITATTISAPTATLESAINHDNLTGFVAAEHLDWSADQGATNLHVNNITEAGVTQHQAALSITESQVSDMPVTVSQAAAEAGTDTTDTLWTAERVKQAIAALETVTPSLAEGCKLTRSTGTTFGGAAEEWDTEIYDTNGFHEGVTNPSRITIPSGVTKVRLVAHIESGTTIDNVATITAKFQKNGSAGTIDDAATSFQPIGKAYVITAHSGVIDLDTGVITVAAGDYFELLTTEDNPSQNVDINAYVSWISCEVIA